MVDRMKRYHVVIEGEMVILHSDLEDTDYLSAGINPHDIYATPITEDEYWEVAEYAAKRMLGPIGMEAFVARTDRSDEA